MADAADARHSIAAIAQQRSQVQPTQGVHACRRTLCFGGLGSCAALQLVCMLAVNYQSGRLSSLFFAVAPPPELPSEPFPKPQLEQSNSTEPDLPSEPAPKPPLEQSNPTEHEQKKMKDKNSAEHEQLWGLRPAQGLGRISKGKRFHCRRPEEPSMPSSVARALSFPEIDRNRTQTPLLIKFDETTFGKRSGQEKDAAKAFTQCEARCSLWTPGEGGPDVVVFNQRFSAARAPAGAIRVMWSSEQLGSFFLHPELDLRISTSLLSNQTEIAFAYGCGYVRACRKDPSQCPPEHGPSLRRRPLPPGAKQADTALVVSIIGNPVKPRRSLLAHLSKHLETANYGGVYNNRKRPKGAGRDNYSKSKMPMMRPYPFAYVPENKWETPWGYVSEKPYDALKAGCLPIWEGGLPPAFHSVYFPPNRDRTKPVLLRPRAYPQWQSGKALAKEVLELARDEERFRGFFDWDMDWFQTGPLARVCQEKSWCKLCAAAHIIRQGHCPPFM